MTYGQVWWPILWEFVLCKLPIQSAHTQQWTDIHCEHTPGARFNKEVQPTLSLNLNSELSYSEMGNSEFSVTEQLNCVSLLNSK